MPASPSPRTSVAVSASLPMRYSSRAGAAAPIVTDYFDWWAILQMPYHTDDMSPLAIAIRIAGRESAILQVPLHSQCCYRLGPAARRSTSLPQEAMCAIFCRLKRYNAQFV